MGDTSWSLALEASNRACPTAPSRRKCQRLLGEAAVKAVMNIRKRDTTDLKRKSRLSDLDGQERYDILIALSWWFQELIGFFKTESPSL